jgi:hypothetical protein
LPVLARCGQVSEEVAGIGAERVGDRERVVQRQGPSPAFDFPVEVAAQAGGGCDLRLRETCPLPKVAHASAYCLAPRGSHQVSLWFAHRMSVSQQHAHPRMSLMATIIVIIGKPATRRE